MRGAKELRTEGIQWAFSLGTVMALTAALLALILIGEQKSQTQ
jgi:hypothetical protein